VRAAAALAALTLAACGGADAGDTVERDQVEEGQAVGALDRDPGPALAACRAAFARAAATPPDVRYAVVAGGCADLFSMPLCGEAVRLSPQAAPELRPPMVAVACQHAYCPIFEAGGGPPELCSLRPAEMSSAELREPWAVFLRAVLSLELGSRSDAPELVSLAIDLAPALSGPVEAGPVDATDDRSAPRLVVSVARDGAAYRIAAEVGAESFGPFTLPLEPDEDDFAGLLEAAALRAAGGVAVLEVDEAVAYGVAIHLMDALRGLGIVRVSLAVDASEAQPAAPE
jgi:biopolymer transport protein ExbD